jgi:PAS domain S-box-containing protein
MSMETTDSVYRDLVECQQDLIVRFSPEGRLLFVNTAYCSVIGKTKDELTGSVFMPVTSERYSDVIATQMTKLFRPPYACMVEQWIQTPKGMRCISWSAKSILKGEGSVESIVATGRDITRFRQEQKALKKRGEELMLVVESGRQMYYTHTPDHIMVYVSPRIRTLLGCKPHTGKMVWTDYLTDNPLNAQGLERTLRAISSGRREPPYRLEMKGRNGYTVWVEVHEIPVVRHGKTVAIAGSIEDITEKVHVDVGLAEAEDLLKISAGRRKEGQVQEAKSPFGFLKSLFSREPEEESDRHFEIPKNLK